MKKLLFLAVLLAAACTSGYLDQECNSDGTCNSPNLRCAPFGNPPIFHHCVLK